MLRACDFRALLNVFCVPGLRDLDQPGVALADEW